MRCDLTHCAAFNPFSLAGKRILVTGASSGFGKAIALDCARMGAELIITGRDVERLAATLEQLMQISTLDHRGVVAEMTVAGDRAAVIEAVGGEIHGLVNNAGISKLCPTRQMSEAHLRELHGVNVEAPILLTQALLRSKRLANHGAVVFISSIAAYAGVVGVGAYSGTKAALIAMARCLALEVAPKGIRVNCLAPALANTPLLERAYQSTANLDEQLQAYPLGVGQPEDVANATIFMLSGASRWITGATLVMDGGLTIR